MQAPEKIYLDIEPNLDDSTWHLTNPNGDSVKYVRKDAFIEKACDAYCKVCGHYPHATPDYICRQACDYYKDFRACIKGK